jgi:nicotinamidase/pyrazinamidase
MNIQINKDDALIIIDPQNDFVPGGALAVAGGDEIMEPVHKLAEQFHNTGAVVVMTQDWHPANHKSFASTHDVAPFSSVELSYGAQVAWPDHCVQGTEGGDFHQDAIQTEDFADLIIRKGTNPEIDSYSAFYENDQTTSTGLAGYLRDKGVKRCFFVGLAYDFCVGYSALDARKEGFEAIVLKDLTRAINMPVESEGGAALGTVDVIEKKFDEAGVEVAEVEFA